MITLLFPLSTVASAATTEVDGNLSVGRCIQQGNISFGSFLNSFIAIDGFYDGVVEPWRDIFYRNACQATDLANLVKQLDKIQNSIRDAFLSCNNQKIPNLQKAYEKMMIEIYFVRNMIDTQAVKGIQTDKLKKIVEDKTFDNLFVSDATIYSKILTKYKGKMTLNETELQIHVSALILKYTPRKSQYLVCESGSWKVVAEKWKEFVDSAGGVTPALKDAKREVGGAVEKLVESAERNSLKGSYLGVLQVNLNKLDPKTAISDIEKQLSGVTPSGSPGTTITQSALISGIDIATKNYEIEKLRTEMASKFYSRYKETSDDGTQVLVDTLKETSKILNDSLPNLNTMWLSTQKIYRLHCPNK